MAADDHPTSQADAPVLRVVDRRWWARGDTAAEGAADSPARKPTYVEDLEQQIADKTAEIQRILAEHRRALDEFEQAKLRIRRDVGREVERGRRAVFVPLLEVVDNLDRAIAAAREVAADPTHEVLVRGVEIARDQFLATLEGFGVVRIPALGERFDPARHEAVTMTPVADPAEDNTVVAVLKEGYAIGDEPLRPAAVVVGQATD